jgi:hypothetical protein
MIANGRLIDMQLPKIPFITWFMLMALIVMSLQFYSLYSEIREVHYAAINDYLSKKPKDKVLFSLVRGAMYDGDIDGLDLHTITEYLMARDSVVVIATPTEDHAGAKERLRSLLSHKGKSDETD